MKEKTRDGEMGKKRRKMTEIEAGVGQTQGGGEKGRRPALTYITEQPARCQEVCQLCSQTPARIGQVLLPVTHNTYSKRGLGAFRCVEGVSTASLLITRHPRNNGNMFILIRTRISLKTGVVIVVVFFIFYFFNTWFSYMQRRM